MDHHLGYNQHRELLDGHPPALISRRAFRSPPPIKLLPSYSPDCRSERCPPPRCASTGFHLRVRPVFCWPSVCPPRPELQQLRPLKVSSFSRLIFDRSWWKSATPATRRAPRFSRASYDSIPRPPHWPAANPGPS